jgi:hypothetical protein
MFTRMVPCPCAQKRSAAVKRSPTGAHQESIGDVEIYDADRSGQPLQMQMWFDFICTGQTDGR